MENKAIIVTGRDTEIKEKDVGIMEVSRKATGLQPARAPGVCWEAEAPFFLRAPPPDCE